jgi:hypothetical protein
MRNNTQTTRLEIMREKLEQVPIGYHRFLTKFPKYKDKPICFVEGEDEAYYGLRVKIQCENQEPYFIKCNGKKGVIQTYELINKSMKFKDGKLFYFVDRDFDELISNLLIYETPCYSIENFYTTIDTFIKILRNRFKITEDDEEFEICIMLFKERQNDFHKSMLMLNSWIKCVKEQTERIGTQKGPSISNLELRDFVKISLESVQPLYDKKKIEDRFSGKYIVPDEELEKKMRELQSVDPQAFFRGKFEIEFLRRFLEKLQEELARPRLGYFNKPRSISGGFTDIVSSFSQYAETPSCLVEYLKRVWFGYVNASA